MVNLLYSSIRNAPKFGGDLTLGITVLLEYCSKFLKYAALQSLVQFRRSRVFFFFATTTTIIHIVIFVRRPTCDSSLIINVILESVYAHSGHCKSDHANIFHVYLCTNRNLRFEQCGFIFDCSLAAESEL